MPLQLQLFTAAVLALTGVALALVYDVYRAARRVFRWRGLIGEFADLGFWVVSGALLALGAIAGSWGAVRWHAFLMIGAGAAAYFQLAAPLLSPFWRQGWGFVRRGRRRLGGFAAALLRRARGGPGWVRARLAGRRRFRWPWPRRRDPPG